MAVAHGIKVCTPTTIKNFNANAGTRSPEEQVASAIKLLEKAW